MTENPLQLATKNMKIGLLIVNTGKYKIFLQNLLSTADKYFLKDYDVTYYVFTDKPFEVSSINRTIEQIIIPDEPFPFPTLHRYKYFTEHSNKFEHLDYLYYVDSDMIFENSVGSEIFSDIVCVTHPGYMNTRGVPETNPNSLAYIPKHIPLNYVQNAFFGGSKDCVLNMCQFLAKQIDIDYKRGFIARWWDESHANKFYICYATKVLSPEYCNNKSPNHAWQKIKGFIPRISIIPKNNNQIRKKD